MKLLTLNEVAELLRVHRKTVMSWVSANKLPAVRLGNRTIRFDEAEVMKMLKGQADSPLPLPR